MINSKIQDIYTRNYPVKVFSINGANDLTVSEITVNNADGDSNGGHNTDAFDVGSSTGVYITNPAVHNQDDCLAVNSGMVRTVTVENCSIQDSQNGMYKRRQEDGPE